jgi:hypothetical protein
MIKIGNLQVCFLSWQHLYESVSSTSRIRDSTGIISIRRGGAAEDAQVEVSQLWLAARKRKPTRARPGSDDPVFQLLAVGVVQGPCSQEVPNAIDVARSPMREAKLGRQLAPVMRSCK